MNNHDETISSILPHIGEPEKLPRDGGVRAYETVQFLLNTYGPQVTQLLCLMIDSLDSRPHYLDAEQVWMLPNHKGIQKQLGTRGGVYWNTVAQAISTGLLLRKTVKGSPWYCVDFLEIHKRSVQMVADATI